MLRTDFKNIPNYGRANELICELRAFATYAQIHGREDFAPWLLEAYTAMSAVMPSSGGTQTSTEQ